MYKLYIENRDGKTAVDAPHTAHFVYADGELENHAGYDIVCCADTKFNFRDDRIEDVVAVLPDGTEIESKLFFWHELHGSDDLWYERMIRRTMAEDPVYCCHGRLVAKTDTAAVNRAQRLMIEAQQRNVLLEEQYQQRLSAAGYTR